ncbi:hypothetical protein [Jeotgalibaca dankookensis]|uniref:hypothetical protein n=1 Tax=Jeotgalibaca dankookensis TaxID=708126 RepID=UPI0007865B43|nr:hypothetical protein [Jeotgalibaca dankookensis]
MKLKKSIKKMIAPIVITLLVTVYFIFYMWMGWSVRKEISIILSIFLFILPIGLIGTMIYLLIERIKEIKENEDDDLSQY